MNSEQRLQMHLAAVFCNNFTNHLIALAKFYCEQEGRDFNLLSPLIRETFQRLDRFAPKPCKRARRSATTRKPWRCTNPCWLTTRPWPRYIRSCRKAFTSSINDWRSPYLQIFLRTGPRPANAELTVMNVLEHFSRIRTFVFDVDGVLTDGTVQLLPGGELSRKMSIRDGYALQLAVKKAIASRLYPAAGRKAW